MIEDDIEMHWNEFLHELDIARNLLLVEQIKERRDERRSRRLIAKIRDKRGPIRLAIKKFMDEIYNVSLPLILVFYVSSLENFLRRIWLLKIGPIDKNTWYIFSNPKEFAKEIRRRLKVEIGDIVFKANAVVMKRHLIVHKNKMVDQKAIEVFREAGMFDIQLHQKLNLTVEDVTKDIKTIQKFAHAVKNFSTSRKLFF